MNPRRLYILGLGTAVIAICFELLFEGLGRLMAIPSGIGLLAAAIAFTLVVIVLQSGIRFYDPWFWSTDEWIYPAFVHSIACGSLYGFARGLGQWDRTPYVGVALLVAGLIPIVVLCVVSVNSRRHTRIFRNI